MKRAEFVKEINKLDAPGLSQRAVEIAEELLKLRFRKTTGQLQQTHTLTKLRRDLARVQTALAATSKAKA